MINKNITKQNYSIDFNSQQSADLGRKSVASNVAILEVSAFLGGKEEWRNVVGYEELYQVSSYGRVKRLEKINIQYHGGFVIYPEKILKQFKDKGGYVFLGLRKKGKKKKFPKVHRLVAQSFIKNNKNKPCINHIDNNRSNNYVENLEWCTHKENSQHSAKQGRTAHNRNMAILDIKQVKRIKKLKGKISAYIIGPKYNVNRRTIEDIFNSKTWINI